MIDLYEQQTRITDIITHLAQTKEELTDILQIAKQAPDIDTGAQNIIVQELINAITFAKYAHSHLSSTNANITKAWELYRAEHPIIMPRFFILDKNGNVKETDARTFSKLPKPKDNYHVDTREYEEYEDIPGSTMRLSQSL